jgi:phage-related protein
MTSQTVDVIFNAEDKTKAAIDKVQKNLDAAEKKTEALKKGFGAAAIAGTAAFAAIAAIGVKAIRDYGDAQKAATQLEYAVMNITKATREQYEATSALADALERKGVLDGDNIKVGLAQLSTFGLSNAAVQGLAGSLADLAVNQYGVSASGEQLADTANMMAKALRGDFGILQKSGIRFTEAQQAIIKTGTEMEKVAAINEGFQQNLKYTNEVALGTFEGQLAKVNVQLGNVSEGIGKALLPAVSKILTAITPVVEKMIAWIEAHPRLTAAILGITAGLAALTAVVGTLGIAVLAFQAVAWPIVGIIALIVLGIAGLVAIGIALYTNWDTITAFAATAWGSVRDTISSVMSAISGAISGALESINATWTATWNAISAFVTNVVALIVGIIITALDFFFPEWQARLQMVFDIASMIWTALSEFITAIMGTITGAISAGWNAVVGVIATKMLEASTVITTAWGAIRDFFAAIWADIKAIFQSAIDAIIETMKPMFDAIESALSALKKLKDGVTGGVSGLISKGKKALNIDDGVISPNGRLVSVHPDDYIIATKDPSSLGGGNGGITIVLKDNNYYGDEDFARKVDRILSDVLLRNVKVS